MKKLISLFVFACSLLSAQAPCNISGSFTSATTSTVFDNRKLGCYNWRVSYNNTGFSAVSVQLEQAPDVSGVPGTWAAFSGTAVIDGANPTTNTNAAIIGIHSGAAWVRLRLVSVTGSGTVIYQVWGANNQSNFALYGTSPIQVNGGNVSCPSCNTGLLTATLTVTASQVNGMFAAPILAIPAQGPNTIVRVNNILYNAVFGSAAFTGGGNINLFYGSVSPPVSIASAAVISSFLTNFTANQLFATPVNFTAVSSAIAVNAGVYLSNLTAPFAGGTGATLTVTVQYYVFTAV